MIFHLLTNPSPDEFFMTTNMKAEQGDLVLCVITDPDIDFENYQKESLHAKGVLTLTGLMMLQEPVYVGGMSTEDQKQTIIDVINTTKEEIMA